MVAQVMQIQPHHQFKKTQIPPWRQTAGLYGTQVVLLLQCKGTWKKSWKVAI